MIGLDAIKNFYPPVLRDNALFHKYLLKEYLQLMILDHLSASPFAGRVAFIGGTNIRLTKGIDRFSEDLDFDCKEFPLGEFRAMTGSVVQFLQRNGLHVEAREGDPDRLKAFRANLFFPELLYSLGLSGHREERFLIKLECQDQGVLYEPQTVNIRGCGFFFPMTVPTDPVLCAMKLAAMLSRQKGRDFYDAMFLLSQGPPDYGFLASRAGIGSLESLREAALNTIANVDLKKKSRDFEHLLFERSNSTRILRAADFFSTLK